MRTMTHNNKPLYYFDNMGAFLEYTHPDKISKLHGDRNEVIESERQTAEELKWRGGLNYRQCWTLARTGCFMTKDLLTLRDAMVSSIRPVTVQNTYWDMHGSSLLNIGAYCSGDPECIMNYRNETKQRATVSLIYNVLVSSGVSVDVLRWRGIAFLSLIDAIDRSRKYRTNVYVAADNAGYVGFKANTLVVRVKTSEARYDPQAIGFAIGHPGMLRNIVFGFYEATLPNVNSYNSMGMPGTCYNLPRELNESEVMATKAGMLGDRVNTDAVKDEASAARWVVERLKEYGIQCHGKV